MFGLMKPRGCSHNHGAESAAHRRLHYCGTCKTMGKLYGQRSRILLNNDAVFLAELLTALSPDRSSVKSWAKSLQSYNCASLPANESQMPLALRIAAAATLVMSEMKLKDQIEDNPKSGFTLLGRLYSDSFFKAAAHLKEWGVPMDTLWSWCRAQHEREAEVRAAVTSRTPDQTLSYLAEPTAEMTGLVFQHAAAVISACEDTRQKMRSVGAQFGSLIYLLDAFEDDAKDARRGEFNALHLALGSPGEPLSAELRERAIRMLLNASQAVEDAIVDLPIPQGESRSYARRLAANVSHKLGNPATESCCAPVTGGSQSASGRPSRWQRAQSTASRLTAQHRSECAGLVGAVKAPFVFASVLLAALVFPREAMSAASYRECVGVLFNLMFWGAAFNAVLAMPQRLLPSYRVPGGPSIMSPMDGGIPHSSSGGHHETTVVTTTRVRRRPGCCAGCDCDCCCDGCCDACDCACCTCEACQCAECACDSCSGC
jgi:hypothetical protein